MFLTWLLVLFVGVLSRCARVRITERILTCLLKGISYLVVAKRWHWCGSIRQYVFLQVIDAQAVRQYEEAKESFLSRACRTPFYRKVHSGPFSARHQRLKNEPLRLMLNIDWLPYRFDFQTSGCLNRRDGQATNGGLLNVLAPPDHHGASSLNIIRTIVGAAHFIFVHVC